MFSENCRRDTQLNTHFDFPRDHLYNYKQAKIHWKAKYVMTTLRPIT